MSKQNSQYTMKYVFAFLFFFLIGFFLLFGVKWYQAFTQQGTVKTPISEAVPFSLDTPPKNSFRGIIEKREGVIYFESRSATQEAILSEIRPVLQGERYRTDENATMTISYPSRLKLTIDEATTLSIIQTIPANFTFVQTTGMTRYEKIDKAIPVGIRALRLLISQKEGLADISLDTENGQVLVTVVRGLVTVAFNDLELVSNVVTLSEGDSYTFDDATRTGEITKTE